MNICFVMWDYWPVKAGGAETQVRKLAAALKRRGHHPWVLTRRYYGTPRHDELDGVPIHRIDCMSWLADRLLERIPAPYPGEPDNKPLWLKLFPIRGAACWLQRLLFVRRAGEFFRKREEPAQVVDVHRLDWIAGWAGMLKDETSIPVVASASTLPCFEPIQEKGMPMRARLDAARMRLSLYIAKTDEMSRDMAGAETSRIEIVPNGVEIPNSCSDVTANRGVLCICNLTQGAYKGFETLFESWVTVAKTVTDARLTVVGRGDPSGHQEYLRSRGCAHSVKFVGHQDRLDESCLISGVFVLSSRTEGMSNALLEAQAYGLPAVVSDIPGNTAVVQDGVNGFVVPVGDAGALAEKIVLLLKSPDLRRRMGQEARRVAEEKFDIEIVAARFEEVYRKAISLAKHAKNMNTISHPASSP